MRAIYAQTGGLGLGLGLDPSPTSEIQISWQAITAT